MSTDTGSKQRLLIVDDSKVIRVTARKILRDHFETIEAVDGETAWETLNDDGPFSLVVSDLTMPRLDGFGLLERIRTCQRPDIRDVPVIIITGANDSEATKLRASQAGATDFIGKPFDSVHLLARTQAHASAHVLTATLREETFRLEENSATDPLTGLANELAFMDRAYQQLSYAIRHKTTLSVFLIEIDGYPEHEQRFGKPASEAIVRSIADNLNYEIRQEDVVARTGTARFSLLLPGMNMAGIRNLSERISRSISTSPVKHGGNSIRLSVSIGVATPDIRRDTRLEDLLSEATQHLSIARSRGGNQAVFATAVNDVADLRSPGTADSSVLTSEAILELAASAETAEIEIRAPQLFDPEEDPGDRLPTIECRETSENAPLPNAFAGPVSDRPFAAQAGVQEGGGPGGAPRAAGPDIREAAAPRDKAAFAFDEAAIDLEETIVITAPFDAHTPTVPDQASHTDRRAVSADAAAEPATLQTGRAVTTSAAHPVSHQTGTGSPVIQSGTEDHPPRKGFIRRLFGGIFSPFRRRRPA